MLQINRNNFLDGSLEKAVTFFEKEKDSHFIEKVNWKDYPYKPSVKFSIAHSGSDIYLQYIVREKSVRAKYLKDNENVWTDSCVEFFISPVKDGSYYNLEFNCIGTTLVGFGFGKTNRERAGIEITEKIQRFSSLGKNAIVLQEGDFTWTITLIIPLSTFFRHHISDLSGLKAKANFYKCGDELSDPHYVSWNPINFAKPNFHLPEFFGDIVFT